MMNSSRNKLSYMSSVVVLVLCLNLKAAHVSTASGNIISQDQSISGNQTISSSPRGIFELCFFTPEYAPKIADFGLAKLVSRDFSRIITTMQGTRGYIAPEWISGEAITAKADVFSYGMLCFEIISGRRNRDLLDDGLQNYFPTRVANVLTKGEDVDTLLDCRLEGNANKEEVMRACKVSCWCIQDDENDRRTMGQVDQLLEGVIDLGIPPIPQFLDRFSKSLVESIHYHNIYSSTASDSRRGYSSSITISGA